MTPTTTTASKANPINPLVYIAAPFAMRYVLRILRNHLRNNGIEVVSDWLDYDYTPEDQAATAVSDLADIDRADTMVLFTDAAQFYGRSTNGKEVELGYALAKGKRVLIVGRPVNVFHNHPECEHIDAGQSTVCGIFSKILETLLKPRHGYYTSRRKKIESQVTANVG